MMVLCVLNHMEIKKKERRPEKACQFDVKQKKLHWSLCVCVCVCA